MTSPPPEPSYPVKVYRRRARAVRAVHYSAPYAWIEVAQFLGSTTGHKVGVDGEQNITIRTNRGVLRAAPGDYVVVDEDWRVDVWEAKQFQAAHLQETHGQHMRGVITVTRHDTTTEIEYCQLANRDHPGDCQYGPTERYDSYDAKLCSSD